MQIYTLCIIILILGITSCIFITIYGCRNSKKIVQNQKHVDRFKHVLQSRKRNKQIVPYKIYRLWCTREKHGCGGREYSSEPWETTEKTMGNNYQQEIIAHDDFFPFLEKHFGKEHKVTKALSVLNPKYGAARADLMRYAIMYIKGGIYLDFKSCIIKKLPKMPDHIDMIAFQNQLHQEHLFDNGEIWNGFLYVRPKSPIMLDILNVCIFNILYLYENPDKIDDYDIAQDDLIISNVLNSKSKDITLNVTGPIMMTNVIINSEYRNTVLIKKGLSKYIKYLCQPVNPLQAIGLGHGKDHYSKQTEPIVISK